MVACFLCGLENVVYSILVILSHLDHLISTKATLIYDAIKLILLGRSVAFICTGITHDAFKHFVLFTLKNWGPFLLSFTR